LIDGATDGGTNGANQAGGKDCLGANSGILILGTDFIDICQELAARLLEEGEQAVTVEVDPDEAAGDAALVREYERQLAEPMV
jgi:hypothetical protein